MADSGLDNPIGSQVSNETPNRPHKSGIAVIPIFEALRTGPNSLCLDFLYYFRPQAAELRSQFAGPLNPQAFMEPVFPIVVGTVSVLRHWALTPVRKSILNPRPRLKRVSRQIRRDQHGLQEYGTQSS